MYQSIATRYQAAQAVDRIEMPWQVRQRYELLNDTDGRFDAPALIYSEELVKNPKMVIDLCRRISDSQLLSASSLYNAANPNRSYLYDIAAGKLRREDYEVMSRLLGDQMAMPIKDNNFFAGVRETIASSVLSQPIQYGIKQTNKAFAKKQILEDSEKGAKMAVQALIETMMSSGENGVSPLSNKKIKLPKTSEDWNSYQTGQEQVESVMYNLLRSIDAEVNFQELAVQAIDHKTHINAEFAFVDVRNAQVRPRILHPHQVRWLSGKNVTTLEDPAVIAVQVNDYMTGTELLNSFGESFLNQGTGIRGVWNYLQKLYDGKSKWKNLGYDPFANYWTEMGIVGDSWDYILNNTERQYTPQQVNWMRNLFYPFDNISGKLLVNILVQWNYFKLFREKRFKVEKINKNNVRSAATDREMKRWMEYRFQCDYDIDFTPVKNDDTLTRANVKKILRPEIWSFVRVGHDAFLNVGPYQYQPAFEDIETQDDKPHWPVVGRISYENSPIKAMENDAIRANKLWQIFDAKLAAKGIFNKAIIIDKTQGKNPISYLYNGRMSGFIEVDPTRYTVTNASTPHQHLKTVDVDTSDAELATIFQQILQLQTRAEMRVGAGPQVQGISQPYDGLRETQLNIANQSKMNVRFFFEHTQFFNELLQRCADVAKFLYAKDDEVLLKLPENDQKILTLTSKLRNCDFGLKVENGAELAEEMRVLDELTAMLAQSGGAEKAGALLESRRIKNPADRVAYLRQFEDELRQDQQAAAQANAQAKQQELELQRMEIEAKLKMKEMEIEQERWREQFRAEEARKKEDFKGEMADIKETSEREKMLLQSQLNTEESQSQPSEAMMQNA